MFWLVAFFAAAAFVSGGMADHDGIVPDVVDNFPPDRVKVDYQAGSVNMGNHFTPAQVKSEPTVSFQADSKSYYFLAMVDPDAPSRKTPKMRNWNHWLVGNIPGGDVDSGEVLMEYAGSTPPKGSGPHRYVFLVYHQKGKLQFTPAPSSRGQFSIRDYAKKNGLGDPVAANFFYAETK